VSGAVAQAIQMEGPAAAYRLEAVPHALLTDLPAPRRSAAELFSKSPQFDATHGRLLLPANVARDRENPNGLPLCGAELKAIAASDKRADEICDEGAPPTMNPLKIDP
jgi:hypothetical protein